MRAEEIVAEVVLRSRQRFRVGQCAFNALRGKQNHAVRPSTRSLLHECADSLKSLKVAFGQKHSSLGFGMRWCGMVHLPREGKNEEKGKKLSFVLPKKLFCK